LTDSRFATNLSRAEQARLLSPSKSSRLDRILRFTRSRWIWFFGFFFGLYAGVPFLAPVFMQLGWTGGGGAIYFIYSFLCHQLPERSFFFFGPKVMYSLGEIQSAWTQSLDPFILRQFIGNPDMGWKVAWSDRMVSMYASIWIFGLLWWPVRQRVSKLPWWGFVLFLLPMAIDGTTHLIGDLAGLGQGFRDTNAWLAVLTQNSLPESFYIGDALGSFNSWMRLLTGVLFGVGVVWFGFPYLNEAMSYISIPDRYRFPVSLNIEAPDERFLKKD
jgi:uncharacterized membrane protein